MESDKKSGPGLPLLLTLLIGVFVLWAASWLILPCFYGGPQDAGTFGDMFGAINALFSGLAFGGLVFAILLQRKELEYQRLELQQTRVEFQRQTEQFAHQVDSLEKSTRLEVLLGIFSRYSSPDMLNAVRTLWSFYHSDPETLVERYMSAVDLDWKQIDLAVEDDQVELESRSVHSKRRQVSKFYLMLAGLREINAFPDELLYAYWSKHDLAIIPQVLVPIDKALAVMYGADPNSRPRSILLMEQLFADAPQPPHPPLRN